MRSSRSFVPHLVGASLIVAVATTIAVLQAQAPPAPAGLFDLVAADNGGRVEWASYEFRREGEGVAMNLLAATRHPGWLGSQG
jgi:hypothetical protein